MQVVSIIATWLVLVNVLLENIVPKKTYRRRKKQWLRNDWSVASNTASGFYRLNAPFGFRRPSLEKIYLAIQGIFSRSRGSSVFEKTFDGQSSLLNSRPHKGFDRCGGRYNTVLNDLFGLQNFERCVRRILANSSLNRVGEFRRMCGG